MAAGSDPLEELFLSEVDEKAVSDLVGSLESQLAGRAMLPGEGRPGPAGGSVPGEGQRRAGRMAPSPLGEKAAAPAVTPAPAPAPGFGQEAAAGINQRAASASELPPPPATSIPSSDTSAAGARASASAPVSINAVAKSAVNMITQPHVGITKVISSAPGIVQVSATQSQLRTGLGAPQRIVTPQLIIRSQQPPSVQLASGFTIPP
eukprot:g38759.t1